MEKMKSWKSEKRAKNDIVNLRPRYEKVLSMNWFRSILDERGPKQWWEAFNKCRRRCLASVLGRLDEVCAIEKEDDLLIIRQIRPESPTSKVILLARLIGVNSSTLDPPPRSRWKMRKTTCTAVSSVLFDSRQTIISGRNHGLQVRDQ